MLGILGIFGPFLANNRPIWCKLDGVSHWPILESYSSSNQNARYMALDEQYQWLQLPERVMPPIPYNAAATSSSKHLPPLGKGAAGRHWLGTDALGRDVLAGVINGAQTALLTALIALLVSFGLGGLLGGIAGYLGDDRFKVTGTSLVMAPILIGTSLFLLLASRKSQLGLLGWGDVFTVIVASLLLYGGLSWLFRKLNWGQQSLTLPLDTAIMRFAEIMESVPGLIAVLVCVSFLESRTLSKVIVIIGLLSWTGVARFLRAELLKVRQMPYITAVRRLGLPEWRILWRHAVPNALRPVLLLLALSASGAILLESSLSFLNLSSENITEVTWGKMLQGSRDNIEYWWVWLPPGVMITLVSAAMFEVMD